MTHEERWVLRYAVVSHPGQRRELNEDSAYASSRLLVVADGMGGHPHGELASATAVATLAELDGALADTDLTAVDLPGTLGGGIAEVGRRLTALAERDYRLTGTGTTVTALLWDGRGFALGHVGDSRGYLLRGGELHQITRDHTMVQDLIDQGRLAADQADAHPRRSMLMRAVQAAGHAEPDLSWLPAQPGDRYLLCSDGLTGVVTPLGVRAVLEKFADPAAAAQVLVELANEGGAPDNVTCVIADVLPAAEANAAEHTAAPGEFAGAAAS
jgi:protein phosphatase